MNSNLFHTLNISRQDMISRIQDLDVTSNNLANVNTAGFKSSRSNFQELLNKQFLEGNQLDNTQMITTPGTLRDSSNPLDMAIQGEGFFAVTLPDGKTGYTRDGQFFVDAKQNLVTAAGFPVVWTGTGKIQPGMNIIGVSAQGNVDAMDATGTKVSLGTISLTRFPNPSGLDSYGNNVWLSSTSSGTAVTGTPGSTNFGTIADNAVEQSNVDLSTEMTRIISLQRSFSMSLKAFQQTDTMITEAINLRKA